MKIKQFRSILAVAVVSVSITASLSPAQAIPLDGVLDSAGKSFVRGMFGLPAEQQETPQSGGFNNNTQQSPTTPTNSRLVSARVSIYVDGREKASGILAVGQARAFTVDIAGANSYAVVVKPLDGDGYIYLVPVKAPI